VKQSDGVEGDGFARVDSDLEEDSEEDDHGLSMDCPPFRGFGLPLVFLQQSECKRKLKKKARRERERERERESYSVIGMQRVRVREIYRGKFSVRCKSAAERRRGSGFELVWRPPSYLPDLSSRLHFSLLFAYE
jgi:hypothetical protein